ncbi:hypothetical protein XAP6164_3010023 [Xanthomonas phaseoli pv. phaseoli]|nr:hypothetical protein XAP6164_3010023 [Xanthomonas phaseoli pv. phaseoli]
MVRDSSFLSSKEQTAQCIVSKPGNSHVSRCRLKRGEGAALATHPRLLHFKRDGIWKAPFNGQTELFQAVAFLSTGPASSLGDKYSCTGLLR